MTYILTAAVFFVVAKLTWEAFIEEPAVVGAFVGILLAILLINGMGHLSGPSCAPICP